MVPFAMLQRELGFANELADRAADIALPLFHGDVQVREKPDHTPVTEADIRIEEMVRSAVAQEFPDDAVLGEEGGLQGPPEAPRTWIVDPIDGTKNFIRRVQVWATLLALRASDGIELGLVSAPALDERYEAIRGGGATLNGAPIKVSDVSSLAEAHVNVSGSDAWIGAANERAIREVVEAAARAPGFTDFWGHLLAARGGVDAAVEPTLRLWDYAALAPIVEEAGGRMTTLEGGPLADGGGVLTSNGRVHDELVARFR
jgi:histidinol-phosphatase